MPRQAKAPKPPRPPRPPRLPALLDRKLYKTGQTRGADDDVIFQNRVSRNSTVLIPYEWWNAASSPPEGEDGFERGFIALISPRTYFTTEDISHDLQERGLELGVNTLVFYETRADWREYNPDRVGWEVATQRTAPLGGQYVARVPASTAADEGDRVNRGFTTTSNKGAGVRVYEYARNTTIQQCRTQLEALFWFCTDASEVAEAYGMSVAEIAARRAVNEQACAQDNLADIDQLIAKRLLSQNTRTICPLCLEEVSAQGFFNRVEQAEGRLVPDLTVTQLNLFHLEELRIGRYGHRPYNVGWGHHHCNTVVKDSGIDPTLIWMEGVVDRNIQAGYLIPKAKAE